MEKMSKNAYNSNRQRELLNRGHAVRCDYILPSGQCRNEAVPPSRFCHKHSATSAKSLLNQYRITNHLLGESLERHAAADQIKDLRAEMAIVRALVERRLNTIENDAEAVAAIPTVERAVLAVQKLAETIHKMDMALGNVLNKQTLVAIAHDIIAIIADGFDSIVGEEVTRELADTTIESVGRQIVELIASKENELDRTGR